MRHPEQFSYFVLHVWKSVSHWQRRIVFCRKDVQSPCGCMIVAVVTLN
jgi:hypothetical protein